MNPIPILLLGLPGVAFKRAAMAVLNREFSAQQAENIWRGTKLAQAELRLERPRHSFGVNFVLRFFEWDAALYRAARKEGLTTERIGKLVDEIGWRIFGPVFALNFAASRVRSKTLRTRVKWLLDLMFGLLFTAPFKRHAVASDRDIAFNVTVCPLAQYFADQDMPELTRYAACGLDYHMAKLWGVSLVRYQTIAAGDPLCDFRFHVPTGEAAPSPLPVVK